MHTPSERFRYYLVSPSGDLVALYECDEPLHNEDVVSTAQPAGQPAWRVVNVVGAMATVAPAGQATAVRR